MYHHSGEEHEDGELREAPRRKPSFTNFEEDLDQDSLDIKPPQAKVAAMSSSKRKHREHVHHKRSERHQEGMHRHREKHHRDKPKPEHFHGREKERDRHHREQELHKQEQYKQEQYKQEQYRQEEKAAQAEHKHRREERHRRKHEDARHGSSRQEHSDEALQHMRERLLSKRRSEQKHSSRREHEDSALEGEAGLFVKDIINISTKRELTDEEKAEQEMRKEKLLEAEREMARLKEQSQIERERRHHEKALKRKTEEDEEYYTKRSKTEVVTVSSEDDVENDQNEDEKESSYSDDSRSNSENEESNISERTVTSKSEDEEEEEEAEDDDEQLEEEDDMKEDEEVNGVKKGDEHKGIEEDDDEEKEILPPYFPALQGCRSVSEFQVLNRIEEGTYGVVYRAKDRRTEETVALKRLKMEREKEGFPITSLREINTLLKGQHPNIVTVREIVFGSMDKIFIVMDYVEHDLKSLMEIMRHKKQNFMPGEVKCLLQQLLLAVAHLHDNWILHRDLKTSNLLLSHKGILKVGDFGLAREYGSPLKAYTPIVVTLWYRAPELLLQTKEYSTPIDIWSVGCIFAEFLLMNALFPGKSEVEQLNKVFKVLGTPNSTVWPGYSDLPVVKKIKFHDFPGSNLRLKFQMLSEQGLSLLTKFLTYDPNQRITAEEALKHGYFREPPLPIDPAMFPTWPAKSELGLKRALAASPKPPSGGRDYKNLGDDGDDGFKIATGFEERRVGAGFSLKFW